MVVLGFDSRGRFNIKRNLMKTLIDIILSGWTRNEPQRTYLGASAIGDPCERAAWMTYRHFAYPEFDDRMEKLLDHGHTEEARHADGMQRAGIPYRGSQDTVSAFNGLLKGHTDGFLYIDDAAVHKRNDSPYGKDVGWESSYRLVNVRGEWCLWEMKTASHKRFMEVRNHGVQIAKPKHYAQMQIYMGLGKLGDGICKAIYTVTDKDTDHLHCEVVDFNLEYFKELMAKGERILRACEVPARAYERNGIECRWCDHMTICWHEESAPVRCGTCVHFRPDIEAGVTRCVLHQTDAVQTGTCDQHENFSEFVLDQEAMIFFTE